MKKAIKSIFPKQEGFLTDYNFFSAENRKVYLTCYCGADPKVSLYIGVPLEHARTKFLQMKFEKSGEKMTYFGPAHAVT